MKQRFRSARGGRVDRTRPIGFRFDGRRFEGCAGDTLASALLANGVRLVGRSFKYHRPRGILSAGPEEPNALVELRQGASREPNTRATVAELFPGLAARSQNRFPSLGFDLLSVTGRLSPVFAAGFYYKTFMWPASFWERVYEPLIRRAAGLGRAAGLPDPGRYEKQTAFADLLVIGGGPAGITAALEAARNGSRVILVEQDFALGGRLLSDRHSIDGAPAGAWLAEAEAALRAAPRVRILTRTTLTGIYDGGTHAAIERVSDHLADGHGQPRQRLWRLVAAKAVLATGAIERPLVFAGNDLPGVMLAGAVRSYLNRFGVRPGNRAVVFAGNDDAASTIADLAASGVVVAGLVDPRPETPAALRALASRLGIPVFAHSTVQRAAGGASLKRVILGGDAAGTRLRCDLLAMSGGWNPTIHLASHHGGKPVWNDSLGAFVPGAMPPGLRATGAAAGRFLLADAIGRRTGPESGSVTPPGPVEGASGKAFVDFQNDVTVDDIALAAREGFTAVEHLKRYTTLGMGTDQGKTSNVTGLAIIAAATGRSIPETGTTVFRPPYTPVAIGAMAGAHVGAHFRPERRTPAHDWAAGERAVFAQSGDWLCATHFPDAGETLLQTVGRELRAMRHNAGFCDTSSAGRFDLQGPDAAAFLEFVSVDPVASLEPGQIGRALMLREDGFVFEQARVCRLSPTHFLLTTTAGHAGRMLRHLEFCHQVLRPALDLAVEPITDQWAEFTVQGPRALSVLRHLLTDSNAALLGNSIMQTTIRVTADATIQARLTIAGASTTVLAVAASEGAALAAALLAVDAVPCGLIAADVLRLEDGQPGSAELNGQTTAADLGLCDTRTVGKDCVGRVLAARPALADPNRPRLVGLRPCVPGTSLQAGAHLIPAGAAVNAANDQGHVTSAAYSPTLGHWIGLGLVAGGHGRHGEIMRAVNPLQGIEAEVEIVPQTFYEPNQRVPHG